MTIDAALVKLNDLYAASPEVECFACGYCCVEPHMGFVEFVLLFDHLMESRTKEELIKLVSDPPAPSEAFEGNAACPLKEGTLCGAREGRPLSCRLEGLPALDRLFRREAPVCARAGEKSGAGAVGEVETEALIQKLVEINTEFHPAHGEPYFLDGLNLSSWFAVIFDKGISQKLFKELRAIVRTRHDVGFLDKYYVDHTRLKEKLDLIDLMTDAADKARYKYAAKLLRRIIGDFPQTGSYFVFQGEIMLQEFEALHIDQD